MPPDAACERKFHNSGWRLVAGIDEAGRGCWAGPVVAAAVVFSPTILARPEALAGIDDSKALTRRQRERAYAQVYRLAEGVGVGVVPPSVIDASGIVPSTRLAMTVALLSLPCPFSALLIDALSLEVVSVPQYSLIKGDARCLSIAAASIVAKVTRDRLMQTADRAFPGYGFARHKGYGTDAHWKALQRLGPCGSHRMSFRPVAGMRDYLPPLDKVGEQ
ncbi:MAG: ribonuclease HII [Chloroflexaceae bacterium]|nr:ribonuclease HII [Chloroflexaceae bacterium]